MSIYHQNLKHISRGKGQSTCAAAAYRSGTRIYDERLGKTHNYEKKQGVDYTEILSPSYAPSWVNNRAQLWNEVEKKDTRINARPASELDIALPIELSQKQQIKLIKTFAQTTLVSRGLIVDLACHDLDSHNPHAHLMFTTRKINEQGLGEKDRDIKSKDFLNSLRQEWEEQANTVLSQAKRPERIDCRTLEEQGIVTRLPQIHLGPNVCQMKARGISTDRSDQYDEIEQTNTNLTQLDQQLEKLDTKIQKEQERQRKKEKKRQQEAEKKAQRAQAQKFNSLEELDPERDTRLKWDHLNIPDSQRLNQCIQIHHQFKQILNDKNFPIEVLKHDPEFNSPQSQIRFRITHNNQYENWVVTKTDQDFYLTQLNHKRQDPQGLPKKLHLSLNDNQNPIVREYNINLGEHHKLLKTIPDILNRKLETFKAQQKEKRAKARKKEQKQLKQLYNQLEKAHQAQSSNSLYLSESTNRKLRQIFTADPPQSEYLIKKELGGYSLKKITPRDKERFPKAPEFVASSKLYLTPNPQHEDSLSQNQREKLLQVNWQSRQEEERQKQEQQRLQQIQEEEQRKQAQRQKSRKSKQKNKDQELEL
jgi:hypothetical protein